LEVEGYVEYNGAVSARRSFHTRKRSSLGRVPLSQSQQILRHDCTISITGFAIWSGMTPHHKSADQGREPCKRISTNFRAFAGQSSALPAVERP
jgi:hypothetical protein